MVNSALEREESRGAQKRSDFTELNDKFLFEIIQQKNEPNKRNKQKRNSRTIITDTKIN